MSPRSSANSSKPAASEANSSSSSGRRFALTSLTVTSNEACWPPALAVVVGERDVDRPGLACARAAQLFFEARDQPPGAELEQLVTALAAVEWLTVDRADVVDHDVIAVVRGALDGLERREPVAQLLELLRRSPRLRPAARGARPRGPCTRRAWPAGERRSRSRTRAAGPRQAARRRQGRARPRSRFRPRRSRSRTKRRASSVALRRAPPRGRAGGSRRPGTCLCGSRRSGSGGPALAPPAGSALDLLGGHLGLDAHT